MDLLLSFFWEGNVMPSNLITNISLAVGAGGNVDIQPAAGTEWLVEDFVSSAAFVSNVPDLQVSLYDGASACISLLDPTTDPGKRNRQYKFYLTNAVYMRITNTGGAGTNVGYFGEIVRAGLTRSAVATIGAAAGIEIQPPVNETWVITEWGADTWTAGEINPDVEIGLTDGTLVASRIIQSTMVRGQDKQPEIYINNDVYLYVYSGTGCEFAYCGRRVPPTCISSIQDVAGSANLDIQPPVDQQWVITEIGAETWAGGGAPDNYPDIRVGLRTTGDSNLLQAGSVGTTIRWNSEMRLKIDNVHFLRIEEISTANNEVCVSGYLDRSF